MAPKKAQEQAAAAAAAAADVDVEVDSDDDTMTLNNATPSSSSTAAERGSTASMSSSRKWRMAAYVALAFVAVVGIGAAILLTTTHSATITLPKTFSVRYTVAHKDAASPDSPYTGILHKTEADDGHWIVSGRVEITKKDDADKHRVVVTYLDDRGYIQVFDRATGELVQTACATPNDLPPMDDFADSIADAAPVPADEVNDADRASCGQHSIYAVKFYAQTYLVCLDTSGTSTAHRLVGHHFTSTVYDMDSASPANPLTVPANFSGNAMECEPLGIATHIIDATTGKHILSPNRRLVADVHAADSPMVPIHQDWYLTEEAKAARHEAQHHEHAHAHDAEARRLDHDEGCCNCRRMAEKRQAAAAAAQPQSTNPTLAEVKAFASKHLRARKLAALTSVPKPSYATPSDIFTTGIPEGHHSAGGFCLCCVLAGLESGGDWNVPDFCSSTQHIDVDVSKPWTDDATQRAMCTALAGGDQNHVLPKMHIFAQSTSNLVLAAAIMKGYCQFDNDEGADYLYTAVEGVLADVEDPEQYCAQYNAGTLTNGARRLSSSIIPTGLGYVAAAMQGAISQESQVYVPGFDHMCVPDANGDYVPTPALAALAPTTAGIDDARRWVQNTADTVVPGRLMGLSATQFMDASLTMGTWSVENLHANTYRQTSTTSQSSTATRSYFLPDGNSDGRVGVVYNVMSTADLNAAASGPYFGAEGYSHNPGDSGMGLTGLLGRRLGAASGGSGAGGGGQVPAVRDTAGMFHTITEYYYHTGGDAM